MQMKNKTELSDFIKNENEWLSLFKFAVFVKEKIKECVSN